MKKIDADLALLATLATPLGIRIAYEALSWGRWVNEYPTSWEAVKLADRENVGLLIDSYHILVRGTSLKHLDEIPAEKVSLVQLSDYMWDYLPTVADIIETAWHHRVFPGERSYSPAVAEIVQRLDKAGYRGDYIFEVFNDDYLQCPPAVIAARARKSAAWLVERVSGAR